MAVIGYACASATDQNLTLGIEALHALGCTVVRSEQRSRFHVHR